MQAAHATTTPTMHAYYPNMYTKTIDHDTHAVLLEHHKELNSKAAQAEPDHYTVIEPLMDKLNIPDDGWEEWANEVAEGMSYTL